MDFGDQQAMPLLIREVLVSNEHGLHARPAMDFVDTANKFQCVIRVIKQGEDEVIDGKSIMQMMTLAAVQGTMLRIEAEGEDASEALADLVGLFDSKFGED